MKQEEEPKEKKKRKRPLPIYVNFKEYVKLLQYTRSMHHKIAFMLAWESGLRISEVMHLQKVDIDVENKTIRINEGKGCKDRIVPLPFNWAEHHMDSIPMKCSARAIQKAFEMYAEMSGLYKLKPKVHFHSLRHGFATHQYELGMEIPEIQMALGHNDISTTMIYVNLHPKRMLDKYDELNRRD